MRQATGDEIFGAAGDESWPTGARGPKWSAHSDNAALEKQCPESVCSFVVLIKNEISDEGAKYEHTGKDSEKN